MGASGFAGQLRCRKNPMRPLLIAPSRLASDFSKVGREHRRGNEQWAHRVLPAAELPGEVTRQGGRGNAPVSRFRSSQNCAAHSDANFRNQRDTSNFMIPVPLLTPKFATVVAA